MSKRFFERQSYFSKNERLSVWRVKDKFERPRIQYYPDSMCWCFEMTVFHRNIYMRFDRREK